MTAPAFTSFSAAMFGLSLGALAGVGIHLIFFNAKKSSIGQGISVAGLRRWSTFGRSTGVGLTFLDTCFALFAGALSLLIQVPVLAPITFVTVLFSLRQRRVTHSQKIFQARSEAWPDAIEFLISSVRAGLSIGPALVALHEQGPDVLKPILLPAREALSRGATTSQALMLLKSHAQDAIADRLVLILEISQSVGGSSLATILRSLSTYVRAESRTRAELLSRQAWTVNAAKLAVAAPWLIVLLLSIRAHDAYATASGSLLLLVGSLATSLGYGWMRRAARLPLPVRLT